MTQVCTTSWFFRGSQMHESPVCSHDFESRELEVSLFKIRTPCCAIVGLGELVSLILHKGMFLTSHQTGLRRVIMGVNSFLETHYCLFSLFISECLNTVKFIYSEKVWTLWLFISYSCLEKTQRIPLQKRVDSIETGYEAKIEYPFTSIKTAYYKSSGSCVNCEGHLP